MIKMQNVHKNAHAHYIKTMTNVMTSGASFKIEKIIITHKILDGIL